MHTFGPDDKKKINKALKTISESWSRIEAERDLVKNTKKDICGELDLDRRTFTRVAKTFHRQNLDEEQKAFDEYVEMYDDLTKK